MSKKVQIATGTRGGKIAKYVVKQGKMKPVYVDDSPDVGTTSPKSKAEKKAPVLVHGVRIPPGHTLVWSSPTPEGNDNGLIALTKDVKGRTQYVYSQKHWEEAGAAKWGRLRALLDDHPEMSSKMRAGLNHKDDKVRQAYEVLNIINETGMRVGSNRDTMADKKAFGASTLLAGHVSFAAGAGGLVAVFDFIGKKGVRNHFTVEDQEMVKRVKARVKQAGGKDKPIFPNVDDEKVRDVMDTVSPAGRHYKVKDLRTLKGTSMALRLISSAPPPPVPHSEAELKKARMDVAKQVAGVLGNTPAVALSYYVMPHVFDVWAPKVA